VQSALYKASEPQEIESCDGESECGAYSRERRVDDGEKGWGTARCGAREVNLLSTEFERSVGAMISEYWMYEYRILRWE